MNLIKILILLQGHQMNMPNPNMMPNLPPEHMMDPNFEGKVSIYLQFSL